MFKMAATLLHLVVGHIGIQIFAYLMLSLWLYYKWISIYIFGYMVGLRILNKVYTKKVGKKTGQSDTIVVARYI